MSFYEAYCDFLHQYVALHSRAYPDHRTIRTEKVEDCAMIASPDTIISVITQHQHEDFFKRVRKIR